MLQRLIQLLSLFLILQETILKLECLNTTLVKLSCDRKLDFKSISEFQQFMVQFKDVTRDEHLEAISKDLAIKKCLDDQKSLFALDKLISEYDRTRPCKFHEIGKLEQYARQYFVDKKRPLSLKFFTLFGVNIGLKCAANLLAHVKQADMEADQLDFIYSMASPTGWNVLINEHTKKSMKFGSSSAGNEVTNRIAKLIPGLVLIDQLDYMSFDHVKNDVAIERWRGVETGSYKFENQGVAPKMVEFLSKIIESCQNLDQFYVNSLLSLSRLNELGLFVNLEQLSAHHERSMMLHKWLAAASFCQLMIRVEVMQNDDNSVNMKILHHDNLLESRRRLYSYVAQFDDISQEAKDKVWLASVPEGQWLQKNQAMFRSNGGETASVAMRQLNQFIRGLERDYQAVQANNLD